jgi:hypothetical protein
MFGAYHNRERGAFGPIGGYEFGNLIEGGYVSIMSYEKVYKNIFADHADKFVFRVRYTTTGFTTRINYFSSPDLTYSGVATGDKKNDVRRAHRERKELMNKWGDESKVLHDRGVQHARGCSR